MKRSAIVLGVFFSLAFLALALLKWYHAHDRPTGTVESKRNREGLAAFWDTYHEATELRTEGNYEEAAEKFRAALDNNPRHEESLYYLGNCLLELGEYVEATSVFRQLAKLNPQSHRAYSQLGVLLSSLLPGAKPELQQAKRAFEHAARLDPEESGTFLRLGRMFVNQEQLDQAYEQFVTAAGFASPEGMFWSGYVRYRQNRFSEANEWFRQVLDTAEKERQIASRGAVAEGDSADADLPAPLRRAEMKARLYLYWSLAEDKRGDQKTSETALAASKPGLEITWNHSDTLGRVGESRGSWGDLDQDGDLDLILTSPQVLFFYENIDGQLVDMTQPRGLSQTGGAWDACMGDYDSDGDLDLYLIRSGPLGDGRNSLFRNDLGSKVFVEVTSAAGLQGQRATTRAVFADLDGDARPDLLEVGSQSPSGSPVRLFHNREKAFQDVTKKSGLDLAKSVVDVAVGDYDSDGDEDLFFLLWRRHATLFRNEANCRFVNVTLSAGLGGIEGRGFSALFFDYNQDEKPDLLVTAHGEYDSIVEGLVEGKAANSDTLRLFRNNGDGRFEEVTQETGLAARCHGVMQAVANDINCDGWPDLALANGSLEAYWREPSCILLNKQGSGFIEGASIPSIGPANALGIAIADFNGDGLKDLYLSGSGLFQVRKLE